MGMIDDPFGPSPLRQALSQVDEAHKLRQAMKTFKCSECECTVQTPSKVKIEVKVEKAPKYFAVDLDCPSCGADLIRINQDGEVSDQT